VSPEIDTTDVSVASKVNVNDAISSSNLNEFVESPTTGALPRYAIYFFLVIYSETTVDPVNPPFLPSGFAISASAADLVE
jgi:hypothetical protein